MYSVFDEEKKSNETSIFMYNELRDPIIPTKIN